MLFVNSARAIFTMVIIATATPAFVVLIVPLSGVYYWVQRYYLRTSRELKRLDKSKSNLCALSRITWRYYNNPSIPPARSLCHGK